MTHQISKLARVVSAIAVASVGTIALAVEDHAEQAYPPLGVQKQDAEASLKADIGLLAEGKGIVPAEAARAIDFQEQFAKYAQDLAARYPNQLSRIWLEPAPGVKGYIQFTGRVPYSELAPKDVYLLADGVITRDEHAKRAQLAAAALKTAGYTNFLTFFDVPLGSIRVEMVTSGAAPDPDRRNIIELIQDEVARDQGLTREALAVAPSDVDLRVVRRDGEIYTEENVRGGIWLLDDGVRECTSGWSVNGPYGPGIITAAHCTGLNGFEGPGNGPKRIDWRDQERGIGDVEYLTTWGIELPEFYADASTTREVKGERTSGVMFTGMSVCRYGRSTNVRDCSHSISARNVTTIFNDGVTVSRLVCASGDSSIPGDSGGGWSWGNIAWGVHAGSSSTGTSASGYSCFTPMDIAQGMLNVTLMVAP